MEHSQEEMQQYVSIIDRVAIISKTDLKGNITFVNDIFCDVAGYTREELVGQPHSILRHPDMPKTAFDNLWSTIQSGKPWAGKVKNKTKDGSAYHVNAHIFPLHDNHTNDISGYMAVRFLTTDEIEEQRKFKTQVRDKLSSEKAKQQEFIQEIKRLNDAIRVYKNQTTNDTYATEQLEVERKNKRKLTQQLNSYENELDNMTKVTNANIKNAKTKTDAAELQAKIAREKVRPLEANVLKLTSMTQAQTKQIQSYEESLRSQAKMISDLKDVISSLEDDKEKLLNGESLQSI